MPKIRARTPSLRPSPHRTTPPDAVPLRCDGTQTSADGFLTVTDAGVIRLTAAGATAGAASDDLETAPNSFVVALEAGDAAGNWSAPASITLSITDAANGAPVISGPGGGTGATTAITVAEGTTAVATLTPGYSIRSRRPFHCVCR